MTQDSEARERKGGSDRRFRPVVALLAAMMIATSSPPGNAGGLLIDDGSDVVHFDPAKSEQIGAGVVSVGYEVKVPGLGAEVAQKPSEADTGPLPAYRPGDAIEDGSDVVVHARPIQRPFQMVAIRRGQEPTVSSVYANGVLIQTAWTAGNGTVGVVGTVWTGLQEKPKGQPFSTTVKVGAKPVTRIRLPGRIILSVTVYHADEESSSSSDNDPGPMKIGGTGLREAKPPVEDTATGIGPDLSKWHSDGIHHSIFKPLH